MKPLEGRRRVVVEDVRPQVDCGRFPAKRIFGERLVVTAAVFGDGHDILSARLLHRKKGERGWQSVPMLPLENDQWAASFALDSVGRHEYSVEGWVDDFATWLRDFEMRAAAGQNLALARESGALLLEQAAARAKKSASPSKKDDAKRLLAASAELCNSGQAPPEGGLEADDPPSGASTAAIASEVAEAAARYPDLRYASRHERELAVEVDRERAGFSAWYELFPRSASAVEGCHGTFKDCEAWLPYIAAMGFDVLYLPPIHPIGKSFRKGRDNAVEAAPDDVGSPWAIGSDEGGHTSIHPQLGTLEDFHHLVQAAREAEMEVALDIAFQCSPDHPWVIEHSQWFRHRPDGSIQYAENPPKKYQDIYPLDFESADWRALWDELKGVFLHWARQGVRIFRVDNPHTKAFAFWEWAIAEVKKDFPDAIFLAEAFTRPRPMLGLAKRGFSQSYTYFTWRTTKAELTEYFTELSQTDVREFYRANLWPNTPDILHESLQLGGRAAFILRVILAATLSPNYGIYGPAYELCENLPAKQGSEEYLHSEKYEVRHWETGAPSSIAPLLAKLNSIRRNNAALRNLSSLRFHETDNESLICCSKRSSDSSGGGNTILTIVNLDPVNTQIGWTQLDLKALGLAEHEAFTVRDLLTGDEYHWSGARNYIELVPERKPAHIFEILRDDVPRETKQPAPGTDQEAEKFSE